MTIDVERLAEGVRRVQVYDGEGDATLDVLVLTQIEADWLGDYLEGLGVGDVYVDKPPSQRLPAIAAEYGTPASPETALRDALWTDPEPRTPEGNRLWDRLCAAPRGSDDSFRRDVGQRICQIENEAATLAPKEAKPSWSEASRRLMESGDADYTEEADHE